MEHDGHDAQDALALDDEGGAPDTMRAPPPAGAQPRVSLRVLAAAVEASGQETAIARAVAKDVLQAALDACGLGPTDLARAAGVSRSVADRFLSPDDSSCIQLDKLLRIRSAAPALFVALVESLWGLSQQPLTAPTPDAQLRLVAAAVGDVAEELTRAQAGGRVRPEAVRPVRRRIAVAVEHLRGLEHLVDRTAQTRTGRGGSKA